MSQATFQIAYDGPALENHAMDVRQLSPALLAVGDLCREANYAINRQDHSNVTVKVRANFDEGCFDITFDIVQIYQDIRELVRSEGVADAKAILEWIGLIGGTGTVAVVSLLGFLKWKRGLKIRRKEIIPLPDGSDKYRIYIMDDESTIDIEAPVYHLFTSLKVRSAQRRVVEPLKYEGIDVVEVREKGKAIMKLTRSEFESGSFDILESETEEEERLESHTISAVLALRSPVFDEGKRWQFWWGGNKISTSISDEAFNRRVFLQGERFGIGDHFDVKLSITQLISREGKITNQYDICEVVTVKSGPVQMPLLSE